MRPLIFTLFLFISTLSSSQGQVTFDVTPNSCDTCCDGSIDVTVIGCDPPYLYVWTGPNGFAAFDEDLDGICDSPYNINIFDNNGEQLSEQIEFNPGDPPFTMVSYMFCGLESGECGLIAFPISGPAFGAACAYAPDCWTADFTFTWYNQFGNAFATTPCLDMVVEGVYTVVIEDDYGETVEFEFTSDFDEDPVLIQGECCSPDALSENIEEAGRLYPNPLNDTSVLDFGLDLFIQRTEIIDIQGRLIQQREVKRAVSKLEVHRGTLAEGQYIMKVVTNSSPIEVLFLVQ